MKSLQILFCLLFAASVTAQTDNHNVYLNSANFEFLNESAAEVDDIIGALSSAASENNFNLASKTKSKLLSLVYKSASASHSLCNIVEMSIQNESLVPERYQEMDNTEYTSMMKDDENYVAAAVSSEEASQLTSSVKRIYELKEMLSSNKFQVHPGQEHTASNLELLKEFASIIKNTADLYSTAKSRS